jgi:hypothetical protein
VNMVVVGLKTEVLNCIVGPLYMFLFLISMKLVILFLC